MHFCPMSLESINDFGLSSYFIVISAARLRFKELAVHNALRVSVIAWSLGGPGFDSRFKADKLFKV